jgi:hypothetical protein
MFCESWVWSARKNQTEDVMNNNPNPFFTTPELMTLLTSSTFLYLLFSH